MENITRKALVLIMWINLFDSCAENPMLISYHQYVSNIVQLTSKVAFVLNNNGGNIGGPGVGLP